MTTSSWLCAAAAPSTSSGVRARANRSFSFSFTGRPPLDLLDLTLGFWLDPASDNLARMDVNKNLVKCPSCQWRVARKPVCSHCGHALVARRGFGGWLDRAEAKATRSEYETKQGLGKAGPRTPSLGEAMGWTRTKTSDAVGA